MSDDGMILTPRDEPAAPAAPQPEARRFNWWAWLLWGTLCDLAGEAAGWLVMRASGK